MPDELADQWQIAPSFLESFGWATLDAGELEADDLLGALAQLESAAGGRTLIFSGDRDMFQCACELVTVPAMGRQQLRSVRAETNLTRAPGLWTTGNLQLELPLDAPGLGVAIRANGRLNLTPDLDVLAWLAERWYSHRLPDASGKLNPHPEGVVGRVPLPVPSECLRRA